MKTYDEMTSDILEKTKNEKARRAKIRRRVTSGALALVIVLGAVFVGRVVLEKEKLPEYSGIEKDLPGAVETRTISTDKPSGSLSAKSDYAAIYANLIVPVREDTSSWNLFDKIEDFVGGIFGIVKEEDGGVRSAEKADMAEPNAAGIETYAGAPLEDAEGYDEDAALAEADYSQTNVQVAGIDEADVVKTDGRYIYAISHQNVYIYEAKDGEMTLVSKARFIKEDGRLISNANGDELHKNWGTPELYFTEDRLIVVLYACEMASSGYNDSPNDKVVRDDYYYPYYDTNDYFTALVYDISDRSAPSLLSVSAISGCGISSRMIGDTLYLVASDRYYDIDEDDPETFIPSVYNDGDSELVDSAAVYCPPVKSECFYLNALELDVEAAKTKSSVSLLGYDGEIMYQSENAIYVAQTNYGDTEERKLVPEPGKLTEYTVWSQNTTLTKLSLDGGLALAGSTTLEGRLLNSFSMDEYDGYLRVVTSVNNYYDETTWYSKDGYVAPDTDNVDWDRYYDATGTSSEEMYNALFVLDGSLNVVGSLENIAPDERVYSCRFEGTQGYFVTYRETDPLFHVDISDPTAPKIVGELKLPGYSAYLQRFGEYMLGFGVNDEGKLKVSMFSENEDGSMKEIDNFSIENAMYSEALYDHHAILADASRGVIAFGASVYYDTGDWDSYYSGVKYFILSYGEDGFKLETSFDLGSAWPDQLRGFYIGDFFYVYQEGSEKSAITSLDFGSFEVADEETMDSPDDYVYDDYGVICYD